MTGADAQARLAAVLPFTLRVPVDRVPNDDGVALNVGTQHIDVRVIADPTMEGRGETRHGFDGPVIALREWNEQVFLHELLHVVTGYAQPLLSATHPPHGHDVISRIEVALWETGWRMDTHAAALAPVVAEARAEERERIAQAIEALPVMWAHHGLGAIETVVRVDAARIARADREQQP